jgi:hypothetical protein
VTQIELLSAAFSGGEQPKIARTHVGRVWSLSNNKEYYIWPRKFESVARNELVRGHIAAATLPHSQIIRQNEMYLTSAYPHLPRKFSDGDTAVLHDKIPRLVSELVISAC